MGGGAASPQAAAARQPSELHVGVPEALPSLPDRVLEVARPVAAVASGRSAVGGGFPVGGVPVGGVRVVLPRHHRRHRRGGRLCLERLGGILGRHARGGLGALPRRRGRLLQPRCLFLAHLCLLLLDPRRLDRRLCLHLRLARLRLRRLGPLLGHLRLLRRARAVLLRPGRVSKLRAAAVTASACLHPRLCPRAGDASVAVAVPGPNAVADPGPVATVVASPAVRARWAVERPRVVWVAVGAQRVRRNRLVRVVVRVVQIVERHLHHRRRAPQRARRGR
mmetsp:Transcript_48128/g.151225  ORF Transcript_48128/g.151225 Transcript_48128/m.151225 type:complete len:279 (+) Transcript_48128:455-1291(+)